MLKNELFRVQSGTAVRLQLHFSTACALSAGISWGKWATLKKVGIPSQYLDCVLLDYCVFAWHQMDNNPLHQRGSTIPHTNQPRSDYGQWQLAKKIWRTQLWMILTYNDRSPLSIHLYLAWAGLELPANMRDKDVLLVSDREKFSQLPAISSPHFFTCENCCLPNNTSSCFGRKSPQFVLRGTRSAANPSTTVHRCNTLGSCFQVWCPETKAKKAVHCSDFLVETAGFKGLQGHRIEAEQATSTMEVSDSSF